MGTDRDDNFGFTDISVSHDDHRPWRPCNLGIPSRNWVSSYIESRQPPSRDAPCFDRLHSKYKPVPCTLKNPSRGSFHSKNPPFLLPPLTWCLNELPHRKRRGSSLKKIMNDPAASFRVSKPKGYSPSKQAAGSYQVKSSPIFSYRKGYSRQTALSRASTIRYEWFNVAPMDYVLPPIINEPILFL